MSDSRFFLTLFTESTASHFSQHPFVGSIVGIGIGRWLGINEPYKGGKKEAYKEKDGTLISQSLTIFLLNPFGGWNSLLV